MILRPGKPDVDSRERALWPDLLSLGLVFPISIFLGFFLGRWIGGLFGHPYSGQWVGLFWGIATGFWELYKVTMRANRLDGPPSAARKEADEHEPKEENDHQG